MSNRLTAWLRTVVPAAWSALITWLVALGAPEWLTTPLGAASEPVIVPIVLGAVYAGLRWLEPHLPAWLVTILAGSHRTPSYDNH
ncbi:hypothetical protein GCM10012275_39310 [Longimycelium tulufanense]|uniref:Uncharacterized protein n=1 Tax=Longimycelium tulufanense TaxID=907463 RepID=A0A8J3CEX3_9PSEU|nr:hypothetical protein [Longimycelium tulufanense]GGM64946.1 hypothetical protein GCM10012275_39310 [Longimycelium tulufanense]